MGNPFGNLTNNGLEASEDRLGGYAAKETDIYTGKVKAFYAGQSAAGAHNITFIMTGGDFGSNEYRETVYITNKGGENFYLNRQDNSKKVPLPGFTVIDDMCLATTGKSLSELNFEEKVMNIYDPEQKKELPKSVQMCMDMLDQEVSIAVVKTTENQTEKDSQGNYVPKADGSTRDVNHTDKVFNTATKMTVAEARGGATTGTFWDSWLERNKGKTRDKTERTGQGGQSGRPGGSAPQGNAGGNTGGAAPRSSLFAKS